MPNKKRYIVTFHDEEVDHEVAANVLKRPRDCILDAAEDLCSERVATEDEVAHHASPGIAVAYLEEGEVAGIAGDSAVAAVEEDFDVELADADPAPPDGAPGQSLTWNIEMVKAPDAWARATGAEVKVAVVDTGISANHPDLTVQGGASYVDGLSSWDDDQGHGSLCAGILAAQNNQDGVVGVAPDVSLYAIKIFGEDSETGEWVAKFSSFLSALTWSQTNEMDVVSMSLHWKVDEVDSVGLARAVKKLDDRGTIMVAASGNDLKEVRQPARSAAVLAVGALDRQRRLADFSTWKPGGVVDLCAPGGSRDFTDANGDFALGDYISSTWLGGSIEKTRGTSMSCPHVAGAAAMLKQLHPDWGRVEIHRALVASAQDLGDTDRNGAGMLDCLAAVSFEPS